jgi:putative ABC transport system permease protein
VESFHQDVRYAFRVLGQSRAFAAVAVLTLALGIGTNLAIFTLADGMLFRPLPYRDPDRLVLIQGYSVQKGQAYTRVDRIDFEQLRAGHPGLDGIATLELEGGVTRTGADGVETFSVTRGTPNLLDVLGVRPALGRALRAGDEALSPEPAMLTYDVWRTRFGSDPAIVGRTLAFEQLRVQVVGVLPQRFIYPLQGSLGDGDLLMLRPLPATEAADPRAGVWSPIARLKPGVTVAEAQRDADVLVRQAAQAFPETSQDRSLRVSGLQEALFEVSRPLLWLLVAAAAGVLAITCVNLANLLLARGALRQRELQIRTALGASRGRVARQLLVESLVIGLLGAVLALVAAGVAFDVGGVGVPARFRLVPPALDLRLALFTIGLSLVTSVAFGIAPALWWSSPGVPLRHRAASTPAWGRLPGVKAGAMLIALQVALATVLLTATGLTANSLIRRRTVDLGFHATGAVSFGFGFWGVQQATPDGRFDFSRQVLAEVRDLPGVEAAGIDSTPVGNTAPMSGATGTSLPERTGVWSVTSRYFDVMGIRLTDGRPLSEEEVRLAAPVAVVSESVARAVWPGARAVGGTLTLARQPPLTVVGVVPDMRRGYGRDAEPAVYRPLTRERFRTMTLVARSDGPPAALGAAVKAIVRRHDPRVAVSAPQTLADVLDRGILDERFQTLLFSLFGIVGLLVSAVGIHGVTAQWVGARTREMGVRAAIGARPEDLRRMVLGQAARPLIGGLTCGIGAAMLVTTQLRSLLYDVTPHDPLTYAVVGLTLVACGLAAAYVPARHASRVDPVVALRAE